MKKALILATALLAVSCGTQHGSSEVLTSPKPPFKADYAALEATNVKVVNTVLRAVDSRDFGRMETLVTLAAEVGCLNDLTPAQFQAVKKDDGKVDLYVSVYEKFNRDSLTAMCTQEVKAKEFTITVPFMVEAENINLINIAQQNVKFTNVIIGFSTMAADRIEIIDAEPLCPTRPGLRCITNGTSVSLRLDLNGCLDDAAFAYAFDQSNPDEVSLKVSALNLSSKLSLTARCIAAPTRVVKATLMNRILSKDQIKLSVLSDAAALN